MSIADHAADAAAILAHLGIERAHVVGHSSGAAIAVQLAVTGPAWVHSLGLLELSLLSVPAAAGCMAKAGPALEAYGAGRHETALSVFLTAVSGLDWDACRAVLERGNPNATAAALKDIDTLFGVELPALGAWTFDAEGARAIAQPVLSVRALTPNRCGSRSPRCCGPGCRASKSAPSKARGTCCSCSNRRRSPGGWRISSIATGCNPLERFACTRGGRVASHSSRGCRVW